MEFQRVEEDLVQLRKQKGGLERGGDDDGGRSGVWARHWKSEDTSKDNYESAADGARNVRLRQSIVLNEKVKQTEARHRARNIGPQ